jgi:hypothetical protein
MGDELACGARVFVERKGGERLELRAEFIRNWRRWRMRVYVALSPENERVVLVDEGGREVRSWPAPTRCECWDGCPALQAIKVYGLSAE